jgi:hypothetical protein
MLDHRGMRPDLPGGAGHHLTVAVDDPLEGVEAVDELARRVEQGNLFGVGSTPASVISARIAATITSPGLGFFAAIMPPPVWSFAALCGPVRA